MGHGALVLCALGSDSLQDLAQIPPRQRGALSLCLVHLPQRVTHGLPHVPLQPICWPPSDRL
eukprot:6462354-Lingulodinium_polyedra.AAC.1